MHHYYPNEAGSRPDEPPRPGICQLHLVGHRARVSGRLRRKPDPAETTLGQPALSYRAAGSVIQTYLDKEVAAGRVAKASSAQGIHCSPFGAIPKKSKPGQWRLILDLSSPEGHSVNDGITKELATSPSTRWSTLGAGFTASKNGCKACLPQRPSTPRGQTPPRHGLARRYIRRQDPPLRAAVSAANFLGISRRTCIAKASNGWSTTLMISSLSVPPPARQNAQVM